MERNQILKMVEPGVSQMIVASELDRIEAFAQSDNVPDRPWQASQYAELGFVLHQDKKTQDIHANFIEASMPVGWKRVLNKERDWRVDLFDAKGRLRGFFKYKPWDYADATFFSRFEIRFPEGSIRLDSAVQLIIWDEEMQAITRSSRLVDEGEFSLSREVARRELEGFLEGTYPQWQSPAAYWS